jgi:ribA/ribD-fused uncharacterized protein
MEPPVIDRFEGEWACLSNFYMHPLRLDGITWKSLEHAYQAAKTHDPLWQREIREARTPGMAKKLGRSCPIREDWPGIRLQVMADLLAVKFAPGTMLGAALLGTFPAMLIEGNWWGDRFYGVCNGEGENWLGALLMRQRDVLRGLLISSE